MNDLLWGRYSPSICVGAKRKEIMGRPDQDHVSTPYVERQNLSMRMGCGASRRCLKPETASSR